MRRGRGVGRRSSSPSAPASRRSCAGRSRGWLAAGRGGREPTSVGAPAAGGARHARAARGGLAARRRPSRPSRSRRPARRRAAALLRARRRRWHAALAEGAPAVARALADALTGGHSVRGAIAEAAASGGVPGRRRARSSRGARRSSRSASAPRTCSRSWRAARGLPAYDTLVAAILLQRDAGGDLAGLLRGVARSLEESARVAADARTATAQARFTAGVVTALPAGAAALAELAQPGYLLTLLSAPIPAVLAASAAVLQIAALVLVRRLGEGAHVTVAASPRSPAGCWPWRSLELAATWRRPGGRARRARPARWRACSGRSAAAPALRLQPGDIGARLAAAGAPPGIGVADVLAREGRRRRRRRAARRCRWRPRRPAGSASVVLLAAPGAGFLAPDVVLARRARRRAARARPRGRRRARPAARRRPGRARRRPRARRGRPAARRPARRRAAPRRAASSSSGSRARGRSRASRRAARCRRSPR